LKLVGVKFKVVVKDRDSVTGDDNVDGFVHLLQLTPALNSSIANWTSIRIDGIRTRHTTRYV